MTKRISLISSASGQGLLEFALILPLLMVLVLGVVEVSYALLDQHVVTKLTREGSNMISRDTTLDDALAVTNDRHRRLVVRIEVHCVVAAAHDIGPFLADQVVMAD